MNTFISVLNFILVALWVILFNNTSARSRFYKDENGRTIFYPDSNKIGYVASDEQIEQSIKSLRKCFLLNISGYRKDIERIFADSETVEKKLPLKIFRQNLARNTSWPLMSSWIAINLAIIVLAWPFKVFLLLMLCLFLPTLQVLFLKIKDLLQKNP